MLNAEFCLAFSRQARYFVFAMLLWRREECLSSMLYYSFNCKLQILTFLNRGNEFIFNIYFTGFQSSSSASRSLHDMSAISNCSIEIMIIPLEFPQPCSLISDCAPSVAKKVWCKG